MRRLRFNFAGFVLALSAILAVSCNKVNFNSNPPDQIDNTNNTINPLVCSAGNTSGSNQQYYPTACLVPQSLAGSSLGIEINNAHQLSNKVFNFTANDPANGTAADTTLYIEIATYIQPDTIIINATDTAGNVTPLLDICNISTYSQVDPTNGTYRPYSSTILQFVVTMPKGTKTLTFDYSNSVSPTYVGVWNLNEFSTSLGMSSSNPFFNTARVNQFRVQSGPLSLYNDNMDPLQTEPRCPNN